MNEVWQNLKKWQKVVVVFVPLAIVVVVTMLIIMLLNPEPNVRIAFETKNNIPGAEMYQIRTRLVDVIRNNTENYSERTIYEGVTRDYNESSVGETTTADFIVDFDSIKESYAVKVIWPDPDDGAPNVIISCPMADTKYPETPCETESNSTSEIESYLPYVGETNNGIWYKVTGGYDSEGKLFFDVLVDLSESDKVKEEVLVAAKDWVRSVGFNPDKYAFYVLKGVASNKILEVDGFDILEIIYNNKIASIVQNNFECYVLSRNEIEISSSNAPSEEDEEYGAVLNVDEMISYDAFTSDFGISISDGRKYRMVVKTDSLKDDFKYVYVAILRDSGDTVQIFANGATEMVGDFAEYVKSMMGIDRINITMMELAEY